METNKKRWEEVMDEIRRAEPEITLFGKDFENKEYKIPNKKAKLLLKYFDDWVNTIYQPGERSQAEELSRSIYQKRIGMGERKLQELDEKDKKRVKIEKKIKKILSKYKK